MDVPGALHPDVLAALARLGVERLYSHQAQAIRRPPKVPTIVTTGTASGKSMCFNLPTLHILCEQSRARALYLYPTKALAQDQARALAAFGLSKRVRPAIYDGDTPREARADIRRSANVVLTNPDMLHVGILPNHAAWAELFANLAVVVVDEAHVYRGVFGSHVAGVLRRLRRIAAAYGTDPLFLLTSATIANPVELAERLTGPGGDRADRRGRLAHAGTANRDVEPASDRRPAWRAPLGARRGRRAAGAPRARGRARDLLHEVAQGRRAARAGWSSEDLQAAHPELAGAIVPYRAGYTAQQRRELEERLTRGELRAVSPPMRSSSASTSASSTRRSSSPSPAPSPRCARCGGAPGGAGAAWRCTSPARTRSTSSSAATPTSSSNVRSRRRSSTTRARSSSPHTCCAPRTRDRSTPATPSSSARACRPRPSCSSAPGDCAARGRGAVAEGAETYVPRDPGSYPAAEVSLRSASPDSFAIVDVSSGELLGPTEAARAHSTVHDGAIYLHLGRSYEVRELDLDRRRALVAPFEGDWYTQPKRETTTQIERLLDRREALGVSLSFGEVSVTDTVLAYQRRRLVRPRAVDLVALDLPDQLLHAGPVVRARRGRARRRRSRWSPCSARCTRPSTPRSRCCR